MLVRFKKSFYGGSNNGAALRYPFAVLLGNVCHTTCYIQRNVPGVDSREETVAEEPIVYRQIPEPPVYVQARGIPP